MTKALLDQLTLNIFNIELYTVHTEWQHKNVISPYSRLYYITQGSGTITLLNRSYSLEPGYIYLIPAFTSVDLHCPDSFTHYYIHFTTTLANGQNLFSVFPPTHKLSAAEHDIDKLLFEKLLILNPGMALIERDANKPIFQSLIERHEILNKHKTPHALMQTEAYMRLLIAPFIKDANKNSLNPYTGTSRFQEIIKYINTNISKPITLNELAGLANLNHAYFSSLFTKHMGVSPIRYVNTKKVEKAQTLLLSTTKTLNEIAYALGYDDVFYFSRMFKKITGLPPIKYRKQTQHI